MATRYMKHYKEDEYISKCTHFVLYITLACVSFLVVMHLFAPIYGFASYRFLNGKPLKNSFIAMNQVKFLYRSTILFHRLRIAIRMSVLRVHSAAGYWTSLVAHSLLDTANVVLAHSPPTCPLHAHWLEWIFAVDSQLDDGHENDEP